MRKVDLALWADYDVIGRAKEFDERVKSENEEFNALWREMRDRSFFLTRLDADTFRRYERLLEIPAEGSLEARQKRIFAEWNRRAIWTERSLREFLDGLVGAGEYTLKVLYSEYVLEFEVGLSRRFPRWTFLHKRLREIIPANLGMRFRVRMLEKLYFGGIAQHYKVLTVDWNHVQDTTTEETLTLGGMAMMGRTLTVPPSVFDRSRVDGTLRTGGWITMRRLIVCNTVR